MIQQERLIKTVEYLKANQTATLAELARLTEVSIDTARRDLGQLEAQGMLKRVRGGAVYHQRELDVQVPFEVRQDGTPEAKREIASQLGAFIVDGQSVLLNSGTTNMEIASFLVKNYTHLTVLTNNLYVLDILAQAKKFITIVPGGIVDVAEGAIWGDQCERDLMQYNIDTAILSPDAISLEKGITGFHPAQASVVRMMMQISKRKIFGAEHTKCDRTAWVNICGVDESGAVISDSGLSEDVCEAYEKGGVTVVVPDRK